MKPLLTLLFLAFLSLPAIGQTRDTIRIGTYNVLNVSNDTEQDRQDAIAKVLAGIDADILCIQGVDGTLGAVVVGSLANRTPGRTYLAQLHDGPDSDPVLIYDPSKVTFIGETYLIGTPRDIGEYTLRIAPQGDGRPADTIRIYIAHLKAGETSTDRDDRSKDALAIRYRMERVVTLARQLGRSDTLFVLAGDLNTYTHEERAYQNLIDAPLPVGDTFVDPLDRPGDWSEDSSFTAIHTQSTRVRAFGGGASSGLDDRFDFLLMSPSMLEHYIPGSYTAFGNDGQHYNDSINRLPNAAVPDSIAEALYLASDHLPVYADLVFTRQGSAAVRDAADRSSAVTVMPQPATNSLTFHFPAGPGEVRLRLFDATGRMVLERTAAADGELEVSTEALTTGVYTYEIAGGETFAGRAVVVR